MQITKSAELAPSSANANGQADTDVAVEASPEVTEEKKKEELLSPKYAQLARKEKALLARDREIKAREEALANKEKQYASEYIAKSELSKRAKENPLEFFKDHGLSYDQVTQALLNPQAGPAPEILDLQKKIESLEAKLTEQETNAQNSQKTAYAQAVAQISEEVKSLVSTDVEFETIKELGAEQAVVQYIEDTFKDSGRVLKTIDAVREVEQHLVEEALKMAKLKKVQEKQAPPVEQKSQASTPQKPPQQMKTLTNSVNSSRQLSAKERAILAFKGEL